MQTQEITIDDLIEILDDNGFIVDDETKWDNYYVNVDQLNICWDDDEISDIEVFYYDSSIDQVTEILYHASKSEIDVLLLKLSYLINVPEWALGEIEDVEQD